MNKTTCLELFDYAREVFDKDPWQYEEHRDGSEWYRCFWCDACHHQNEFTKVKDEWRWHYTLHKDECLIRRLTVDLF